MRASLKRLLNLFNQDRHEQDLQQELEANLQFQIEDNIRSGMTPDEARRAARIKFGSIDAAKEQVRERRGIPFLETLTRDVIYALRMLRKHKGWSAVAVFSLALGVGANSAIFALIHNYALEKLPVPTPDELVVFRWYGPNTVMSLSTDNIRVLDTPAEPAGGDFSFDAFERFRSSGQTLSDIFAFAHRGNLSVSVNHQAEFVYGQFVSGTFFSALGIRSRIGRLFTPSDDVESADPVVVISYPYWQRRFQSDPRILGTTITINSTPLRIVGVAGDDFVDLTRRGSVNPPDITIPLVLEPRLSGPGESWLKFPQNWWLTVMGRMKPGVTAAQVQASLSNTFDQAARDGWNSYVASMPPAGRTNPNLGAREVRIPQLRVVSASRGPSDPNPRVFTELTILTTISAIVLLIVCVNLANLFFSRAASRQKEIGVRLAIGASRRRVAQQLLTESLLVSVLGGAVGLPFAVWCTSFLSVVVFRIDSLSGLSYRVPEINFPTLVFSGALTLLTGLLFGVVPAVRSTQTQFMPAMREGEGRFSSSRTTLGRSLLVAQVALSVLLLIGAGLLLRTFWNLRHVEVGFNPNNMAVFTAQPGRSGYNREQAVALYERMEQRLLQVPGVRSVTFAAPEGLLAFGETQFGTWVYGRGKEPVQISSSVMSVAPNFFTTMEVPLKRGRSFTTTDTQASPSVAVVNEALARLWFPGANPVGQHFGAPPQAVNGRRIEIVGVVADAKINSLRDAASPLIYRPIAQLGFPSRTVAVRTDADPAALIPAIRAAVQEVEPNLPLGQLSTQMDRIAESYLLNERVFAFASSLFGALALLIAMIGLFGLMSYSVARRTKEIGIRMALGAQRERVLRSVLTEAVSLAGAGVFIGIAAAIVLTRLMAPLLYGLAPYDPLTLSAASLLMLCVSLLAGYIPARRASRVDPMIALRYE